jgi:hypothetical protein
MVSFTLLRFSLRERAPGTYWLGDWVGLRVGLDVVEKRETYNCRESNPGHQARRFTD